MPEEWLLEGLFSKEAGALELLFPAARAWADALRVLGLYGVGLLTALWPRNTAEAMDNFRPTLWRCALLAAGTVWAVLSFSGITTFIYSNF